MSEHSPPPCPKCRATLFHHQTDDIVLRACATCRGVWLDHAGGQRLMAGMLSESTQRSIARVDARPAGSVGVPSSADASNPGRPIACPVCGAAMVFVSTDFYGVCVDVCARHGTWFDQHEIRAIAQAIAIKSAADDAFVETEMAEVRRERNKAIMNRTPLGCLINSLR